MTPTLIRKRILLYFLSAVALGACATSSQVTTVQALSESADAPYRNVLVIVLLSSFDSRRYLEEEVVRKLSSRGTEAIASTSLMNTKTPMTRQTFVDMAEATRVDAVLVTRLVGLESTGVVRDMRPEATYDFRPTYYYNVWDVELTEYVEPQAMDLKHTLVLATQLFSVRDREAVWAIEAKSNIVQKFDKGRDYSIFVDEASNIVNNMSRDGLIVR